MPHAAISHFPRFAAPVAPARHCSESASAPRAQAQPAWASHARHVIVGAGGFAAGVGTGALWLAPRVMFPGILGATAFVAQATTGFIWRHLARNSDAPAATGVAADAWRGMVHALHGVIWGLMLPAAFGPALGVWLGVSLATAAVAYLLDDAPAPHTAPAGTWEICGAVAHGLSELSAALWLQLLYVHKKRSPPPGAAAQAVWRVELAHSQARARQAWHSLAIAEQNVWQQAGLNEVLGPPSWATVGRLGWSAACALGAWYTGVSVAQAIGIGISVGVALVLPRRAMAHVLHARVDAAQAAHAGQDLVYHVLIAAFGMSYYAR